ncbi:MAG: hypothetical protein JOZ52_00970 [Acidobacteria bacterium]|nr:hypothetical protein [Acidobacteriota bacterium]
MLNTAHSKYTKAIAALLFLSAALLVQGCSHHQSLKFASHKVMLDREGLTNRFGVEERNQVAIFRYDGYCYTGDHMKVTIENEKVTVNDKVIGMLKPGDTVHINADGLAVNSLDYGQTEKYLQANSQPETSQNIVK